MTAADPVEGALLRLAALEEAHAAARKPGPAGAMAGIRLLRSEDVPWLLRLVRERYALQAAVLALADEMDRDAARSARVGCDDVAAERAAAAVRIRGTVTAALAGQASTEGDPA